MKIIVSNGTEEIKFDSVSSVRLTTEWTDDLGLPSKSIAIEPGGLTHGFDIYEFGDGVEAVWMDIIEGKDPAWIELEMKKQGDW